MPLLELMDLDEATRARIRAWWCPTDPPGEPRGLRKTVKVHFRNEEDVKSFSHLIGLHVDARTRTIWWPRAGESDWPDGSLLAKAGVVPRRPEPKPLPSRRTPSRRDDPGPRKLLDDMGLDPGVRARLRRRLQDRGWEAHWRGMPEFVQDDLSPHKTVEVRTRTEGDLRRFFAFVRQPVQEREQYRPSIWFPEAETGPFTDLVWKGGSGPRHPVYIPTKGRWKTAHTIRAFRRMGIPFQAVVEPQEAELYAPVVENPDRELLILPFRDRGLVATRNWIWDHAEREGHEWFWTFDDNISGMYRLNQNTKRLLRTGAPLRAVEEMVSRYENVPISGFHYDFFNPRKERIPPFYLNTRVYSNMLIRTGAPYRNEGFYNDDTDLCLRILKDGLCTILFNAFLIKKITTMKVEGGMTPFYRRDGRLKATLELKDKHPDVVTVTRKWGRWHHDVNYTPFEDNELQLRPDVEVPEGTHEFGMRLEEVDR